MTRILFNVLLISLMILAFMAKTSLAGANVVPWSRVEYSKNKKYVLVLLSPWLSDQRHYVDRKRQFWRDGGIPEQNVPEAEKLLQAEIDKETEIRTKYAKSGLYSVTGLDRTLLWETSYYYDAASWIRVSDDGQGFAVGSWGVRSADDFQPILDDTVLSFFVRGDVSRQYAAKQLIKPGELTDRNSENIFGWILKAEIDDSNLLRITKLNHEVLTFELDGTRVQEKNTSVCKSTALLATCFGFFWLTRQLL